MLTQHIRQTIHYLRRIGQSNHEIAKSLHISRNTVKRVLECGEEIPVTMKKREGQEAIPFNLLQELFTRCRGNAVRIKEILKEEYGIGIAYTTLKYTIQRVGLRQSIQRVGEYCFKPGEEMQHDTSPHWVIVGDQKTKLQCASLILGYSRKLFMAYYPCYTRFEAKTFLKEALEFMTGSCQRCVIDNTSVILASGCGADAVISPEMLIFGRVYGFHFIAHRIRHSDRKGKIERPFHYIENNFLSGRAFKDLADINRQAKEWCIMVNSKEKRALGMSPDAAFIQEKPYLIPLPEITLPIYEPYQRLVDSQGYVNLETNRYSIPEKLIGKTVDVYKYPDVIRILYQHQEIAVHPRLFGKKFQYSRIPDHHSQSYARLRRETTNRIEVSLRGDSQVLNQYLDGLKKRVRGSGHRPFNRLLNLKRTYPADAFNQALERACHYGMYDLNRLEELILKCVAGDYFNLEEGKS